MVVLIVDQHHVFALKEESQSPVAADLNGPMSSELTLQRMKMIAGSIHITRSACNIEGSKESPQS